jgi:steroid 5-alpha reductase family enzyme
VRKPNYAAEQFIWFSFYIFSAAATSSFWNWSGGGFLSLIILFQGSGWLTEQITSSKYPEYIEYQRVVPLYVPNILALINGKQSKELALLTNKRI